ncbi:MAG TPA: hypothetical protein VIH30_06700 [Aquirhabdus sp.]
MLTPKFFDYVRGHLFGGKLLGSQVKGIETLVAECVAYGMSDIKQVAYVLATAYHETAKTMMPIREFGGFDYFMKRYDVSGKNPQLAKDLGNNIVGDGATFCGRGYVQITGRANYQKFKTILNIDLIKNPELALLPENASRIAVYGMAQGRFTGKKLSDYINCTTCNYASARRIINGMDKADLIAGYAKQFELALS